jgi:hypothetical protein
MRAAGLRAFEARWRWLQEETVYLAADSAGKARASAARVLEEYWSVPFGRALRELRVRRAPWMDLQAAMRGRPGSIGG